MTETSNIQDYSELIEGCRNNNRKFQEKLYQTFCGKMFAVCLRYAHTHEDAEDIVQEGFVKVFKSISQFRNEGSFEGWIRRIFVHTAIEIYRKNAKMFPIVELTPYRDVQNLNSNAIDNMSADELMKMVQSLSSGYRTVFSLYAIEGFTHREIGEMLGISEGTSKSQMSRARILLQNMIEDVSKKKLSKAEVKEYGK
jgi:RNA polymerase sigma-70 factor (ECF subfamily)